jgi:hypothetical protein
LPEPEIDEILRELRGHAEELAETQGMDAALRSLGDPVDLARTYRGENAMSAAQCSGSPLVILEGLRNATQSGSGRVFATSLYVLGYSIVVGLWSTAIDKLLGFGKAEWWWVPGYIAAGFLLRYSVDGVAKWFVRRRRIASGERGSTRIARGV